MTTVAMASTASVTDVGRVRKRNEDRVFTSPRLIAVADGMGGQDAGDRAAQLVVDSMVGLPDVIDSEPGQTVVNEAIQEAMDNAAREICAMIDDTLSETTETMVGFKIPAAGSTVAGFVLADVPTAFHVGDSRVYRFRQQSDEPLTRITHDHSLVQNMVDRGEINDTEAHFHPRRNVITRAVGTNGEPIVEFTSLDVEVGDLIIICSDGLSDELLDTEIAKIIEDAVEDGTQGVAYALRDVAISAGGHDNVTVIVTEIGKSA